MKVKACLCQNSHIKIEYIPYIKILLMPEQQTEASGASVTGIAW